MTDHANMPNADEDADAGDEDERKPPAAYSVLTGFTSRTMAALENGPAARNEDGDSDNDNEGDGWRKEDEDGEEPAGAVNGKDEDGEPTSKKDGKIPEAEDTRGKNRKILETEDTMYPADSSNGEVSSATVKAENNDVSVKAENANDVYSKDTHRHRTHKQKNEDTGGLEAKKKRIDVDGL